MLTSRVTRAIVFQGVPCGWLIPVRFPSPLRFCFTDISQTYLNVRYDEFLVDPFYVITLVRWVLWSSYQLIVEIHINTTSVKILIVAISFNFLPLFLHDVY